MSSFTASCSSWRNWNTQCKAAKKHCVETWANMIHKSVTYTCLHHFINMGTKTVCVFECPHPLPWICLEVHSVCLSVIVILVPYLVLLCAFCYSLTDRERRVTFPLKRCGSSQHSLCKLATHPIRNAALPRHLLETSQSFSQRDEEVRVGVLGGMPFCMLLLTYNSLLNPFWWCLIHDEEIMFLFRVLVKNLKPPQT